MSEIAKTSFIVTVFTVLGMGLGFLSNVVIAAKFGAGSEMDVYMAATTVPLFITSILSGALNFTFIPVFAEYRAKDPSEIWTVVSSFINMNVAVTTVLCVSGIILAYPLVKVLTPGFTEVKLIRSAEQLRWLFPIIIFTAVNELMASVYYSNQRFVVPSLNKITSPLITITFVMLFYNIMSTQSIVFAMLTTTIIQTVLLAVGFFRTKDFRYSFMFDYRHPGVIKILKLMTPLILGMLIYRAGPLIDRFFLSQLSEGSISHIGYAWKLVSVIPPIIATGITISIFPIMSKYAAEKNYEALREIMSKGIRMLFFISIPFVVLLGMYARPVIQLIFERGAFTSADTVVVYNAFAIYLLSLPASVIGSIVSQGFYVLQQNKTIAIIGVLMMGLYVGLCFIFTKFLSYLAIPIAYAIYHNCAIFTTSTIIRKKTGEANWPPITPFLVKCLISALISAILIYPGIRFARDNIIVSVILCATGFLFYFIITKFVLNLEEANLFYKQAADKFPWRFCSWNK